MPLLREAPSPDALNHARHTKAQRDLDKRAVEAFHRRVDQLEHRAAEQHRTLALVERAVRWLPEPERRRARRRLRQLGLDEQLDPFAALREAEHGLATADHPAVSPNERRARVQVLRDQRMTTAEIAQRLSLTIGQVKYCAQLARERDHAPRHDPNFRKPSFDTRHLRNFSPRRNNSPG